MAAFAGSTTVSTAILVATSGIEGCKILTNRIGSLIRLRPCKRLIAGDPLLLVHIRLDQARVDRERLAPHQPSRDTHRHHTFEHPTQGIALAEAFASRTAKYRVIGNLVFNTELTEPAIGKVDLNLSANPSLGSDTKRKHRQADPHDGAAVGGSRQ